MEPANFPALPLELAGMITSSLGLDDIASLRATCKDLGVKAAHGKFGESLKRQTIHTNTKTLQKLLDMTTSSSMSYDSHDMVLGQLEEYTLVDIVEDWEWRDQKVSSGDDNSDDTEERRIQLLVQVFRNLKEYRHRQTDGNDGEGLPTLRLRVAVRKEDGGLTNPGCEEEYPVNMWKPIFEAARRLFHVTMAALNESRLVVNKELDLFHDQVFCNLGSDLFAASLDTFPWLEVFGSLEKLRINASAPIRDYAYDLSLSEADDIDVNQEDPTRATLCKIARAPTLSKVNAYRLESHCSHGILQAVLSLLYMLPELESIDIRWRHTETSRKFDNHQPGLLLSEPPMFKGPPTPGGGPILRRPVKSCTLAGLKVSTVHLLEFLKIIEPAHVSLSYLCASRKDMFQEIFAFLTSPSTAVSSFFLHDLNNGTDQIRYSIIEGDDYPSDVEDDPDPFDEYARSPGMPSRRALHNMPITLSRQGMEDVKRPIVCYLPSFWMEKPAEMYSCTHENRRLYYPPRIRR